MTCVDIDLRGCRHSGHFVADLNDCECRNAMLCNAIVMTAVCWAVECGIVCMFLIVGRRCVYVRISNEVFGIVNEFVVDGQL